MRRWMLLLGLAFVAAAPEAASAALLGDARVAYSAERTVTVNGKSYSGMVFHSPGHERHEQTIAGIAEVVILDVAMKRGFLVVPMLKSYVAFAFPPLMAKLDDPGLRSAPIGRETVNGVPTTKYRIDHLSADGSRAHGYVWLSVQGVLMRIDGTVTRDGAGKPLAIRMELANLVLGSQDPALFQVPPGLVELPAAAFEGLFGRGSG